MIRTPAPGYDEATSRTAAAGVRISDSEATADKPAATGATAGRLTAPEPDGLGVSADAAPTAEARPRSWVNRTAPSLMPIVSPPVFRLRGRGQTNAGYGHSPRW
jgi:hypothetical protein